MHITGNSIRSLVAHLKTSGPLEVIIVGDLMLDEYVIGTVSRISPEAPVPVLKQEQIEWCLGGAANVAANCAHIGANVHLMGLLNANDQAGIKLKSLLSQSRIGSSGLLTCTDRPTTRKQRFVAGGHQLLRVDHECAGDIDGRMAQQIMQRVQMLLKPGSVVLLSDYAKGVITHELVQNIVRAARAIGAIVLVDPKGIRFEKYKGAHFLKPNRSEFEQMINAFHLPKDATLSDNGRALCSLLELDGLIVTLGDEGIAFVSTQEHFIIPGHRREVFDLTGAGDTVFAFLACALSSGLPVHDALVLANYAAAIAVSHHKTYAVSLDELVDGSPEPHSKVFYDWTLLKIELDWLRAEGKQIVVTTLVAHTLTAAHVQQLQYAKSTGHVLVVGLYAPGAVSRDVPVVLAALRYVDFVVPLEHQTPQALIAYVQPDAVISQSTSAEPEAQEHV